MKSCVMSEKGNVHFNHYYSRGRSLFRIEYYRHPILCHCHPQEYYNCFESLGLSHVFPCLEEWFLTCRGYMQARTFCVDTGNTSGRTLHPWWPFSLCNRNAGLFLYPRSFWFLLDITEKRNISPGFLLNARKQRSNKLKKNNLVELFHYFPVKFAL